MRQIFSFFFFFNLAPDLGLKYCKTKLISLVHFLSYTLNAASEGTAGLASNPEVRGAASPSAAASVATQADSLRTLTARLKDAYNGVEVQWLDTEGKGELSNTFYSIGNCLPSRWTTFQSYY